MITKILAAEIFVASGRTLYIANAMEPEAIAHSEANKIGTMFVA